MRQNIIIVCLAITVILLWTGKYNTPQITRAEVLVTADEFRPLDFDPLSYKTAPAGTVTASYDGSTLIVAGQITPSTLQKFREQLTDDVDGVLLASEGGYLVEAIEIAQIVYERQLGTYVPPDAMCYSACTVIFQAGRERYAHESAMLMYHSAYFKNDNSDEIIVDPSGTALYWAFLLLYGIDDLFINRIRDLNTDFYITPITAKKYNIVTDIIVDKSTK